MSTHCKECGILLTEGEGPIGMPCPSCDSVVHEFRAEGSMQVTNYALDSFVAHEISSITLCGADELPSNDPWLNRFILATLLRVTLLPKVRAFLFNFLRRAEGATTSYVAGRTALIEYVNTPRNTISPYFRALASFEICLSQCYQGYEILARASDVQIFEPNDGSPEERLQQLYVDSKHMDRMISGGKVPEEATAAVWITNEGLRSSRATLTFKELRDLLLGMHRLAEKVTHLGEAAPNSGDVPYVES